MKTFDVICRRKTDRSHVWSMTQEATSPALAIAQCCLAPAEREAFASKFPYTTDGLVVGHPGNEMENFIVSAVEFHDAPQA